MAPGQMTDDSELAMCIIHGLMPEDRDAKSFAPVRYEKYSDEKLPMDLQGIQQNFGSWKYLWQPFDIGNTISKSFSAMKKYAGVPRMGHRPLVSYLNNLEVTHKSNSNGSLMRITPMAVFCHNLESEEDLYSAVTL